MDVVGYALATELERTTPATKMDLAAVPDAVYHSINWALAHDGKSRWYHFGNYSSGSYSGIARYIDVSDPNRWNDLANMPISQGNCQACYEPVTNRIYIFAGDVSSGYRYFGYYDVATNTYSANLYNTHFGAQDGGSQRTVVADNEGDLYIYSSADSVEWRRYDAATGTYTNLGTQPTSMPNGSGYSTLVALIAAQTLIWLESSAARRTFTYDGITNTTTERAAYPAVRDVESGTVYNTTQFNYFGIGSYAGNGQATVIGGTGTDTSSRYNREYFNYDLDSNVWSRPPAGPFQRILPNSISQIYVAPMVDHSSMFVIPASGAQVHALLYPTVDIIDTSTLKAWLALQ